MLRNGESCRIFSKAMEGINSISPSVLDVAKTLQSHSIVLLLSGDIACIACVLLLVSLSRFYFRLPLRNEMLTGFVWTDDFAFLCYEL